MCVCVCVFVCSSGSNSYCMGKGSFAYLLPEGECNKGPCTVTGLLYTFLSINLKNYFVVDCSVGASSLVLLLLSQLPPRDILMV